LADWKNTQVLLKYINCLQHLNDFDIAQAVSVATALRSCLSSELDLGQAVLDFEEDLLQEQLVAAIGTPLPC
jgi:hypothetical protein